MDIEDFCTAASAALSLDLEVGSPHRSLIRPGASNLFIVAGPGTGKTAGLALLVLKAIFVDGWPPDAILATTFTRKAATELRSRITRGMLGLLEWTGREPDDSSFDVARIRVGTIDELCQQAVADLQVGAVVDTVVRNATMRDIIFERGLFGEVVNRDDRSATMRVLGGLFRFKNDLGQVRRQLLTLWERVGQDFIDVRDWDRRNSNARVVVRTLRAYRDRLSADSLLDFVMLERRFLGFLQDDTLMDWLAPTRVVLVDEYQDTNLLQERIYQTLVRHGIDNGGWTALVGDDDQALYRFRGATVELFVNARERFSLPFEMVSLNVNYRSSTPIVRLANRFAGLDETYQAARIPGKPRLLPRAARSTWSMSDQMPVMAVFRPTLAELAETLANAIEQACGAGWRPRSDVSAIRVAQPGDVAVIANSTRRNYAFSGERRLYGELEDALRRRNIRWFNPRGIALSDVISVQRLLGLALLCLDPLGEMPPSDTPDQAADMFDGWRTIASRAITRNPPPTEPHDLEAFVTAWQEQQVQGRQAEWPERFPLLELLHELVTWLPSLQESPGVLYLEAITRTLDELTVLRGPTATLVERDDWYACVQRLYRDFFTPIALDEVDLDESVLEVLPLDTVNALTVHQAKGLEFPVCFVDVGADFIDEQAWQRFMRFPFGVSLTDPYSLEDVLRRFSPLAPPTRTRVDRAFDDLVRKFFVAFTRPQHVLVLFGLGNDRSTAPNVRNVATGYTRDGVRWWDDLGIVCI
jgi:DNA helicase II / ATP-dependent DNA helicase PcrA